MKLKTAYKNWDLLRFIFCAPFYYMTVLIVVESLLAAATTWLVIQAGRDVANDIFHTMDFAWIVLAQSAAYVVGAVSWVFAERAGFGAYGRYMLRFAHDNKHRTGLLGDKAAREQAEPFLTNETFHIFFELMFELEGDLKLFFGLIFNSIVLGVAIDAGLPLAYGLVFVLLMALQWSVRKPVAHAYLTNQRMTNRMTAHTYTAWDNITSGNRYNFRLWHAGFKVRLRDALRAQIRAIIAREGLSTLSGILSLGIVFAAMALVVAKDGSDVGLLVGLAATLPRQIEMSHDVHLLASGWNDLLAVWTRLGGACESMVPPTDAQFEKRIRFNKLHLKMGDAPLPCANLDEALAHISAQNQGRIHVRGSNGAGKSTLLAALKARLGAQAYYWPTTERLAFLFSQTRPEDDDDDEDSETLTHQPTQVLAEKGASAEISAETNLDNEAVMLKNDARAQNEHETRSTKGFSSGERQIKSLREIVQNTSAKVYLLDEWDANLDDNNRAIAQALVDTLAARARVVEISHRDKKA